jgi:hypothetical protein
VLLLRPFHPDSYTYSQDGLVVGGAAVVEQRLEQATAGQWSFDSVEFDKPWERVSGNKKPFMTIACRIMLNLPGLPPRPGYGSHDMYAVHSLHDAQKAALSYAIRSAANRFGVARELWPDCAGEHWIYWLSLLSAPEQEADATDLLKATLAWIGSPAASEKHQNAWAFHFPRVLAAMHDLRGRLGIVKEAGEEPPAPPPGERQAMPETMAGESATEPEEQEPAGFGEPDEPTAPTPEATTPQAATPVPDDEFTRDDDDPFDDGLSLDPEHSDPETVKHLMGCFDHCYRKVVFERLCGELETARMERRVIEREGGKSAAALERAQDRAKMRVLATGKLALGFPKIGSVTEWVALDAELLQAREDGLLKDGTEAMQVVQGARLTALARVTTGRSYEALVAEVKAAADAGNLGEGDLQQQVMEALHEAEARCAESMEA